MTQKQAELFQNYQEYFIQSSSIWEKESFIKGLRFASGFLLEMFDLH